MSDLLSYEVVDSVARLGVALLCGAVLGWEREARDKPAGLRTTMLVALGSATAAVAAIRLHADVSANGAWGVADPIRIVSGIIGGIGFLGAGAIIQARGNVHGMTTAATVWVIGGVGVASGLGYYGLALSSTAMAFVVLWGIGRFEHSDMAPESVRKEEDCETPLDSSVEEDKSQIDKSRALDRQQSALDRQ